MASHLQAQASSLRGHSCLKHNSPQQTLPFHTISATSLAFPSSHIQQIRIPSGGTSHLCCRIGQQYLSTKVVKKIGRKVGKSSTMAPTASAMNPESKNSSNDSLEAAVKAIEFTGVHHVGMLCESVERSLKFYCGVLGLQMNPTRPDDKLSFGGAWLNVGSQMIHLMELPNPDPKEGRPEQGGQDRHACIAVKDVTKLKAMFDKAGVPYTFSQSGSSAIFVRDPDGNTLEFSQFQ